MLDDYIESGFLTDSIPFQNAICVICKYIEFQKNTFDYVNDELNKRIEKYKKYIPEIFESGIEDRFISEKEADNVSLSDEIDYTIVNQKRSELIKQSLDYIKSSID